MAVIAGELIDEGRWVVLVPQCQRKELNAGGPSFDSFGQHAHVGLIEPDPQLTVEQRGHLGIVESKLVVSELAEISLGAQLGEHQRRIVPGADHQAQRRWCPDDEPIDPAVDRVVGDHVVVVEDQYERRASAPRASEERAGDVPGVPHRGRLRQVERHSQRRPEHDRVVVVAFQGVPPARPVAPLQPTAQRSRLAGPGWCRHQHEWRLDRIVEQVIDPPPYDVVATDERRDERAGSWRQRVPRRRR